MMAVISTALAVVLLLAGFIMAMGVGRAAHIGDRASVRFGAFMVIAIWVVSEFLRLGGV